MPRSQEQTDLFAIADEGAAPAKTARSPKATKPKQAAKAPARTASKSAPKAEKPSKPPRAPRAKAAVGQHAAESAPASPASPARSRKPRTLSKRLKTGSASASGRRAEAIDMDDLGAAGDLGSRLAFIDSAGEGASRRGLLPVLHPNRDFFLCDLFDYALKDDGVSMEAPIFTLATKPDTTVWHWESKDGNRSVTVTPSVLGRATQHDKDLLIYVVSQMTEALNRGRLDASHRTVRFRVYDYLVSTNKPVGGKEYQRLQDALERMRGTSIKTNIRTGGERIKEGFGILDSWGIVEKSPDDSRAIGVEVTLSKWLFNAVQAREVLTISSDYFRLRKPLERRLYELARKHCGNQARFVIGVELLREKCGSRATLYEFRRMLREVIRDDLLPDYRLVPDWASDQITVHNRNAQEEPTPADVVG